ncbi:MAG: hypothetical protein U5K71_09840 [Gracilimonas sp.]|nr:hypothetical protein [Gracilimonas sp.]
MIYYHQGGHGGQPPLWLMNMWFTRYLFDVENGVEDLPKAWITREDDERDQPTSYPDYPHPGCQDVTFYLSGNAPERGHFNHSENGQCRNRDLHGQRFF